MTSDRPDPPHNPDRRQALAWMSTAVAASLLRCSPPRDKIVPYVEMPERLVPGEPLRFATALALGGYGRGAIGICIDGRPIKIEGNPRHSYSLGATDVFSEAEVLCLYDPDRSQIPMKAGRPESWQAFGTDWAHWTDMQGGANGRGMALVTGRVTSPTLLRTIGRWQARFPEGRHYRYEPVHDDAARGGARLAFGRNLETIAHMGEASAVLTLDADPLGPGPSMLAQARAFAERRRDRSLPPQRLYAVEAGWTLTGCTADYRLALPPSRIGEMLRAIAARFSVDAGTPALAPDELRFANAAADDLMRGRGLIVAGRTQSAAVHAMVHWLNAKIDAPVTAVASADPVDEDHATAFTALLADLDAGKITTLIVLDGNPVYDAPDSQRLAGAIAALPFSVHCGSYQDETAQHCRWHVPLSHAFESWGDIRSPDGTAALIQPLIRPLYDTRTAPEVVAMLAGLPQDSARDVTRESWTEGREGNFDDWWTRTLEAGVVSGSTAAALSLTPRLPLLPPLSPSGGTYELTIAPSPALWDGRYANNAWLQECPHPFTKEVWGNAVLISPEDAMVLNLENGDGVVIKRGDKEIRAAVAILAGNPKGVLATTLGYGRWRAGVIGSDVGMRIAALGTALESTLNGITLHATDGHDLMRSTQWHTRLDGEDEELYPLAAAAAMAGRLAAMKPAKRGVVPPLAPSDYAWAMVIDNDLCIGCNACVVACQAENNVPVVGPEEIARGRDMHWLRVDTYALTAASGARRGFQPVPCMHCETAPCEPVCPVAASVHDHEGLNVQVYNRCIGTRFCEANCPYKVRRFNYFGYARGQEYGNLGQPPVGAQHNPNVSVRGRGVMEKCTYCVQRISKARRQAEKEDRLIADGEVVTACQAACPTRAIHFGNRNDATADAAILQADPRHYALLGHLDTRPRTTYLAKVHHPNPDLEGESG